MGAAPSTTGSGSRPVREALDAFVDKTQELVTGEVRVQLRAGARRSSTAGAREHALYAETLASYATGETFPHDAAEGFIRLAVARGRARGGARARTRTRVTLWAGRVERPPRPRGLGVPPRPTTRSCSRTTARATAAARARGCTPPGCSTTASSPRSRRRLAELDLTSIAEEDEDVHSAIERLLGEVGRKIHAGRSRNDQVAAAMRLYVGGRVRARRTRRSTAFARAVLDAPRRRRTR